MLLVKEDNGDDDDLYLIYFCKIKASVRLSGGRTPNEGRVEILYNQVWGTLCDDGWDVNDAGVLCNELGFPGVAAVQGGASFGEGIGPIHFDQMGCTRDEVSLIKCPRGGDAGMCGHGQDAGVICQPQGMYNIALLTNVFM